jgi:hypothetical protein
VLAVLASTQLPAATLTVRQRDRAGRLVCGSMTWWLARPQRRAVVLDVARPPVRIVSD